MRGLNYHYYGSCGLHNQGHTQNLMEGSYFMKNHGGIVLPGSVTFHIISTHIISIHIISTHII